MRAGERFLRSTRGRVVVLLRVADRTVPELAEALDLTRNAIRGHVAALERDGLVRQIGVRRGVGKPAAEYRLTPEGERLFPKAHAAALAALVEALAEAEGVQGTRRRLRAAASRLATRWRPPAGASPPARLAAALAALGELGAVAEVEERPDGARLVRGRACPLDDAVRAQPLVCGFVRSLVAEIAGARVEERCERGERPRCGFLVAPPGPPARPPRRSRPS